jgi:hypothetical protein
VSDLHVAVGQPPDHGALTNHVPADDVLAAGADLNLRLVELEFERLGHFARSMRVSVGADAPCAV